MLEKGKISPRQAAWLIIAFLMGSAILLIPSAVAATARQDAWLSMILAVLAGLGIAAVYTSLSGRFPGQNFIQLSEIIMGRYVGKLAGLAMIWFALHLGSLVLRNFGDFLTITILQQTPMVIINAVIILLSVQAVKMGLEGLSRVNDLLIPPMIFLLLMITLLAIPETEFTRLLPVTENGLKPVVAGALTATGFPFAETVLFTMIIPYVSPARGAKRAVLLGILIGGLFLAIIILRTILVLGPAATARFWYSALEAVKMIDIFNIIQRIESMVIIVWIGFGFIKITVCLYAFVLGLAQWLNLKDYKPIAMPAGLLMLALSTYVYESYTEEAAFAAKIWFPYAILITFILPLAMLIVAWIRGLGERG